MHQELFFERLQPICIKQEQKMEYWSKHPQSDNQFEQILQKGLKEAVRKAKCIVETSKVYIILEGIVSSGKSTFINSLLGQQLLPSQYNECTKKYLFIKQGDLLRINGETFKGLKEASQYLSKLQLDQSKEILIETPSLFHEELLYDLRDRVILLDKPPISPNNPQNIFEIPDCIRPLDIVIQLILFDFTVFNNQYNQLQISLKERLNKEKYHQGSSENIWLIINKMDKKQNSESFSSSTITKTIEQTFGNQAHVFLISALNGLKYRIMTEGSELAQQEFLRKFFLDCSKQYKLRDQQHCEEFCKQLFKGNEILINDDEQQYQDLINLIKKEIKGKLNLKFQEKISQCRSFDYSLQIIKLERLDITKPTLRDDQSVSAIFNQLERFGRKTQKLTKRLKELLGKLINDMCLQLNGFQNNSIQFVMKGRIIQDLTSFQTQLQNQVDNTNQDYNTENQILQKTILQNISLISFKDDEKNSIILASNTLFKYYLNSKTLLIKEYNYAKFSNTLQLVEKCLIECLEIQRDSQIVGQKLRLIDGFGHFASFCFRKIDKVSKKAKIYGTAAGMIACFALEGHILQRQLDGNENSEKNLRALEIQLNAHFNSISQQFIQTQINLQKFFDCVLRHQY